MPEPAQGDPEVEDDPGAAPGYATVVTGLRLPRPLRQQPAETVLLPKAEIDRAPALTADDLLRTLPQVGTFRASSSLGADPSAQSLNLRGLGPSAVSRALLLWDGIPVNDPFGGWVYFRSLPLLGLGQIEVVPSGNSALFGNLALGGVAQLLSKALPAAGEGPQGEAQVSGSSYGTLQAGARAADRFGPLALELSADTLDSAGYRLVAPGEAGAVDGPAGSRDVNAGTRFAVDLGEQLTLQGFGRFFDERFDAGTAWSSAWARAGSYGLTLHQGPASAGWNLAVFAANREFDQSRARVAAGRASATQAARQTVPSNDQGASLTWTSPPLDFAGQHTLLLGTDVLRVAGTSQETLSPAQLSATALVGRSAGGEQQFAGAFVQDAVRFDRWVDASLALRLDVFRSFAGDETLKSAAGGVQSAVFPEHRDLQLSPRLGVLLHLTDALGLRFSGYRAFRAPTLDELYRPFQVGTILTDANPALQTETLWGGEAGLEWAQGPLSARATGYWNVLSQPVDNVTLTAPLADGAVRQRENLGEARVRGVDLDLGLRLGRLWEAMLAYGFVDPQVTAAPTFPQLVGKQLPQDPNHRGSASLTFHDPRWATAVAELLVVGARYEDDRNTLGMGGFLLLNASVARALGAGVSVFVKGSNLLNRSYLVGRAGIDTVCQPLFLTTGLKWEAN